MKLKEISSICGVSISTVSRVLNNKKGIHRETRKKVLTIYAELEKQNESIYQSISTLSPKTIDLIIPNLNNVFFSDFVKNMLLCANKVGIHIRLHDINDSIEREIKLLADLNRENSQGIILISSSRIDKNFLLAREISKITVPIVLADREIRNCNIDGVFMDYIKGGEQLTTHLLSLKKRKIAVITGSLNSDISEERVTGFYNVMDSQNIPFNPNNIIFSDFYDTEIIEKNVDKLFETRNFDSIICCNNIIAQAVIKKAFEKGISLETDLKIVTFDRMDFLKNIGIKIDCSAPKMSYFSEKVIELLLKKFEKKNENINTIKILPQLFIY